MFHLSRSLAARHALLPRLITTCPRRHATVELWQSQAYIDGVWQDAASGAKYKVYNPANGEVIGHVPDMSANEAQRALHAATRAFYAPNWAYITAKQRSDLLKNWHALIDEFSVTLADIITYETGKPLSESHAEVAYGNSYVDWYAEEARRIDGEIIASSVPNQEIMVIRQPLGVVALITPWNFPLALLLRKACAALASGCTVVIKPAEDTPFTCLALTKLAELADFPPGVINVVTTMEAAPIGQLFCKSPLVQGISFTGSTEVGKLLYRDCADLIKRLSLELGGNAPFIVFDSADIERAVDGALESKFRNAGQTCVSSNRFFVQAGIYDNFTNLLVEQVKRLNVGAGHSEGVEIGPLINPAQLKRVETILKDAVSRHAQVITGGQRLTKLGELFFEPTVISGADRTARVNREEVFGPVITMNKFETEEEVLTLANNTLRGLAGYFYSRDLQQIFRVARRLEVGMVGVNTGMISRAEAPFGGVKESGMGREGSHNGIDEFVEVKYICLGGLKYY